MQTPRVHRRPCSVKQLLSVFKPPKVQRCPYVITPLPLRLSSYRRLHALLLDQNHTIEKVPLLIRLLLSPPLKCRCSPCAAVPDAAAIGLPLPRRCAWCHRPAEGLIIPSAPRRCRHRPRQRPPSRPPAASACHWPPSPAAPHTRTSGSASPSHQSVTCTIQQQHASAI